MFGALSNGIANNPEVLKFVEDLAAKPVEILKLKIIIIT